MKLHRAWFKSSYSDGRASCVEVAEFTDGTIGVRDSKAGGLGPTLRFSPSQWDAFLTKTANKEFEIS